MNFIVDLKIYPFDIMFSVGESDKKFKKSVKEHMRKFHRPVQGEDNILHLEPECRGRTWHHLEGGQTIIRLPKKPETPQEFGTLSHEVFHAVDWIFRHINIRLSGYSDEAYAYLIGYITEQFYLKCDS